MPWPPVLSPQHEYVLSVGLRLKDPRLLRPMPRLRDVVLGERANFARAGVSGISCLYSLRVRFGVGIGSVPTVWCRAIRTTTTRCTRSFALQRQPDGRLLVRHFVGDPERFGVGGGYGIVGFIDAENYGWRC